MSNYSGLERSIARLLGRFPVIKKFAKFSYSRFIYSKSKKSFKYKSLVEPVGYEVDRLASFFGYYDKSPESSKGWVLAMSSSRSTKDLPSAQQGIELVVFDRHQQALLRLPIRAYNWQQGCRAHWLNADEFIFNDFSAEQRLYISRVFSVSKQAEIQSFPWPVQDSFLKDFFISINYQRLMALRPDYGYRNLPASEDVELAELSQDGLWIVDYATGAGKLLVSIEQACQVKPLVVFASAQHKFNHVMISPGGKQLIFMHRYLQGRRRSDRLLLLDIETGVLNLLADYGMVSHCFWADEKTILGYMRGPGGIDAYWLIDAVSGDFSRLPCQLLSEYGDGHPNVHGDWFVTDTYPDKARMQHLILCNWKTGEVRKLGEFFHGFGFKGESRCDLHPRFSLDGEKVFFDSVFTGRRQLYSMQVQS